jgi:hypothetical protein
MNSWLLKNLSMNDTLDVEFRIAVASQGMQKQRIKQRKILAASLFNGPDQLKQRQFLIFVNGKVQ